MTATDLVDRLAAHRTLGAAPREELAWLAAHGSIRQMNTGDVLTAKDEAAEGLFAVLSGRITISVDRGDGPHTIMEWREGDVTGSCRIRAWSARRAIPGPRSRRSSFRFIATISPR